MAFEHAIGGSSTDRLSAGGGLHVLSAQLKRTAQIRDLERELDRRRDNLLRLEREVGRLEGQAAALGYRAF
jgi:hypothetical protein